MTRTRRKTFAFTGRGLVCGGMLCLAAIGPAPAAEQHGGTTVVSTPDGKPWEISIRPAQRTAQAAERSIVVPPAPEDPVAVTSATEAPPAHPVVAQTPPRNAIPMPPAQGYSQIPTQPNEPEPEPTLSNPSASRVSNPAYGPSVAHGVTVVPRPVQKLELNGRTYADAYRSIPFNRAEYNANPSYRHEAAMELMFGQMRPTTVVKQMPAPKEEEDTYSPYKQFIPAYGDYESYQALPLPYPLFNYPAFPGPSGCAMPLRWSPR